MSVTFPAGWTEEFPAELGDHPARFVCRCPACKAGLAAEVAGPYASAFYTLSYNGVRGQWLRCQCGRAVRVWKRVNGRPSPRKCSPRCTGATGPDCECECVGANHGSDHL